MTTSTTRAVKVVLVAMFIIAACICPSIAANPQGEQKVSISANDMPMRQFLDAIEKQCSYSFFYSNSVLSEAPNVTIDAKGISLTNLLHKVFDGTPRTFEFVGDKIAIKFTSEPEISGGGEFSISISER